MAKEICISSTPHETRLAILEDDQLAEIYYERENEYTLAGSVYKGRVTRVLPGMQSAFVDIGLERDAFLYVTDFLEMEDQEDTDEVERAASQGNTQRPQAGQLQAPPQGQSRPDRNGDRDQRQRREGRPVSVDGEPQGQFQGLPSVNLTQGLTYPVESATTPGIAADATGQTVQADETDEQGAKRWRGRRRRRGGRGREDAGQAASPASGSAADSGEIEMEESELPSFDLEAVAAQSQVQSPSQSYAATAARPEVAPASEPRPASTAVPFLLPGESLSKYGAPEVQKSAPSRLVVSELPPDTSDPLPDRTVAKPSTLVEDEIVWDGRGLFPGESIARHRPVETAPELTPSAVVDAEPTGVFAAHVPVESLEKGEPGSPEVHEVERVPFEFSEEIIASAPRAVSEESEEFDEEVLPQVELPTAIVPETAEEETERYESSFVADAGLAKEEGNEQSSPIEHAPEHVAEGEHEEIPDSSASHNVDPLPPSGFRLKDLFGGRKKEEEPEPPVAAPAPKTVPTVSAYAPGEGLVEEEVIDEEEYEFTPLKAHHGDDHDLEELEEETLQQQIRSGALGEMLQEAHLDHRIQLESVDEEESDPDEDEEEANGAPAGVGRTAAPGAPGRDRTGDRGGDRGGRGRRGRSSGQGGGDARRGGPGQGGQSRRSAQTSDLPIISDLLKPGQEILVQIAKEPIAKKGARITSHIALPGRFLVFMPTVSHVGVSRKISSDEERQRLKRVLVSEKATQLADLLCARLRKERRKRNSAPICVS